MKFNKTYYENLKIERFSDDSLLSLQECLYRAKWIAELIKLRPGSILDLGCNNGLLSLKYAHDGQRVVGVDLSKPAIQFCNEFLKRYNLTNSEYIQGMIEEFDTGELFDNIFICEVIEHVDNPQQVLNVAEAHLKPSGIIFVTTPDYYGPFGIDNPGDTSHEHIHVYKSDELKTMIRKRGKIIDFQERQLLYIAYQ